MTSADAMRASDADRERVVQALQEQVGEGRLTLAEFEERSGSAYIAKTVGELRELTKDLPVDPVAPAPPPWQQSFPMGDLPLWAQRSLPTHPDGRPMYPYGSRPLPHGQRAPMRRNGAPLAIVVVALIAVLAVQSTFAALVLFPALPMLFVVLMLLSSSGGRRHR
jgi:hypothetical protein